MANYSPEEIKGFQQKDKRISFQSIFSSLMKQDIPLGVDDAVERTFKINDELYKKYPFPGEERSEEDKNTDDSGIPKDKIPF